MTIHVDLGDGPQPVDHPDHVQRLAKWRHTDRPDYRNSATVADRLAKLVVAALRADGVEVAA